jgi:8-oxo-dGTP diphosphatase
MRISVVAAIIREKGRILITQRLDDVHLARLWEFPVEKSNRLETLEGALKREILEELGVKIRVDSEFFRIDHEYPTKSVRLYFFDCTIIEGDVKAIQVADLRWVNLKILTTIPFPQRTPN